MSTADIMRRLENEFTPGQAQILAAELDAAYQAWMKASDLTELKEIVRELGLSQQRTDAKFQEMAEAQRQMAEEIKKLTQAQLRTEIAIQSMRQEIGGMANSFGYMLENEAYRHLPKFLADKHKINVSSKMIRQQVGDEEINVLAEGRRGKTPVLIVGEAKSRLAAQDLGQLKKKVKEVKKHYPAATGREVVPVMVVHFAREKELEKAARQGVIVVQSFEW